MLELYQAEDYGYSQKVRSAHWGQDQLPFLVDHRHNLTMNESDDIVDYQKTHYEQM